MTLLLSLIGSICVLLGTLRIIDDKRVDPIVCVLCALSMGSAWVSILIHANCILHLTE